jgi:hypothetical protein
MAQTIAPQPDVVEDRLLDAHDVAALLKVPVSWVQQAGLDGRLPSRKIGVYRRYLRVEILAFLGRQSEGKG